MAHQGYQRLEDPILHDEPSDDLAHDYLSQKPRWSTNERYHYPICPCNLAGLIIAIVLCISTNLITAFSTIRWMEPSSDALNKHTFYCKFPVTLSSPYHGLTIA